MSAREQDVVADWLFAGPVKAVNVKFFRGSRDMISVDEFWREFHSALMQKKLGAACIATEAPVSRQKKIDLKKLVSSL